MVRYFIHHCFLLIVGSSTVFAQAGSFEILILGTSQDAGYPQIGCNKECCAADDMVPEPVASIALSDKNEYWIIDATPDFPQQFNMAKNTYPNKAFGGILLTHAHIGHYTGLMYLGREAMNAESVPVYCLPRMAEFLKTNGPWSQLVELGNIKIIELTNNEAYKLSSAITINPMPVPHRDEFSETVGYMVSSTSKKAFYVPDIDKWAKWDMSLVELCQMVDVALFDATFYKANELPGRDMSQIPHPFVVETMVLFNGSPNSLKSKIHFTHFNHTNPLIRDGASAKSVKDAGFNLARTGQKL